MPAPAATTSSGQDKLGQTQTQTQTRRPKSAGANPTPGATLKEKAPVAKPAAATASGAKPPEAKELGTKPASSAAPSGESGPNPSGAGFTTSPATAGDDNGQRNWVAIGLVGAACALAGTFLLGVVVGGSGGGDGDGGEPASPVSTTATTSSPTTSAPAEADDGATQAALDEATARVDELETREDELDARVVALEEELGAVSASADNLAEHNRLLQTWFTADVLARSQSAWDGEVARVCQLADTPTIDDVNYIRALEVIGTPADLLDAALDCRQADS